MGLYRQLHSADPAVADLGRDVFDEILANPVLRLLVLDLDGEIVASTYLNVIPNLTRGASPYALIENVIVDAHRRGTGLGRQIMAGTLEAAWDAGCYKVMLLAGRPEVLGFYEACGFDPDAKRGLLARPPS